MILTDTWRSFLLPFRPPVKLILGAIIFFTNLACINLLYAYNFTIKGLNDSETEQKMLKNSLLEKYKDEKIVSSLILKKRIKDDIAIFSKILESQGYFNHKIKSSILKPEKEEDSKSIVIDVFSGKRFKVRSLKVHYSNPVAACKKSSKPDDFQKDMPVDTDELFTLFNNYADQLKLCGFPYAQIKSHKARVDKSSEAIDIDLNLETGPFVHFGKVKIEATGGVSEQYILNRIPWSEGDVYDQSKIDDFRTRLTGLRLFSLLKIKVVKENIIDGKQDIIVTLKEGKAKTISAGASYSTSEGSGAKLGWTHRNLSEGADRLRISTEYGELRKLVDFEYEIPDFWSVDQVFITSLEYEDRITETYQTKSYGISGSLSRPLREHLKFNYGLFFSTEKVTENQKMTRLQVVGLPASLHMDKRNDILNPTNGFQLIPSLTPKFGKIGKNLSLLDLGLYGTYYLPLDHDKKYVLGFWSRLKTILGPKVSSIPASHRIYMGGSNSLRGYKYQLAGSLDSNGKPLGNKSVLEAGVEPRIKLNKNWGFVLFYEAGGVSDKSSFFGKKKFFHSAGIGVRYFTDFGPMRADIGVPLTKRTKTDGKKVDAPFQFYISIGQSF